MKVKVTPRDGAGNPIPGAGSFEVEADRCQGRFYLPETDTLLPASWCKEIPDITPEPGDIVEDYQGTIFVFDPSRSATPFKVSKILARKPKGFDSDIRDAIENLKTDFYSAETYTQEKAAYERFLSVILGVPYGRVEV